VREGSGRAGRRAGRGAGLAGGWPATRARGGGAGGREGGVRRPAVAGARAATSRSRRLPSLLRTGRKTKPASRIGGSGARIVREYRSRPASELTPETLGSDKINRPRAIGSHTHRAGRGKACRHASIYSLLGLMSSLLQPMWPFGLWLCYELVLVRVEHLQERTSYWRGLLAALL
jgi:hypothetical protein